MITINHLTLNVYVGSVQESQDITDKLQALGQKVDTLLMNDAEFKVLLTGIDTLTNHIADNVQVISDTTATIGTEVDALVLALQTAGVSSDVVAQAQAISTRLKATSDAADASITTLKAVAAKGAPVVPPPPPAITIPPA